MPKPSRPCAACQHPMLWVETEATATKPNRRMPIDANADGTPKEVSSGNLVLTGATSGSGAPIVRYVKPGEGRYVSHFVTCPKADEFRKRKAGQR